MSKFALKGPYETDLKVHFTNGTTNGVVTISLSLGEPPTNDQITDAIKQAKEAMEDQGFRPMTKIEFFNAMMRERLGATENYACPGGSNWDA